MRRCLTDEALERLVRGRRSWWRGLFWRWHLRLCAQCQVRLEKAKNDEQLLEELRRAVSQPVKPSPLSTARSKVKK